MTRSALRSFLSSHRYGVVSSIAQNGTPQSALVGIAVSSDLQIIFDTVKSSRKYRNLTANALCSFVIGWGGDQTAQFEGIAEEPTGTQLDHYRQIYFAAWPECRAHLSWPDIAYFVVQPRWIRYSDFDAKPPAIEEFTEFDIASERQPMP